ncbi:hypothetical protein GGS24DRAFT_136544 [Hypoxylon argillaceum]|nr:hypothetical protein GGS24DRAFT_136544 [Hypoxylon argillaceum]
MRSENDYPGGGAGALGVASTQRPDEIVGQHADGGFYTSSRTLGFTSSLNRMYSERPSSNIEATSSSEEHLSRPNPWFQKQNLRWWWPWWEIAGSVLSIITVGLLIPAPKLADNKPTEARPYGARPNLFISVFTTIAKTTMTASITSCLGQLKWDHFQYRPGTMDHLQFYSDASRGL